MPTVLEALHLGLAHQRSGRLDQAESVYRAVLTAQPENADALHLLAVIACQTGKLEAASSLARQAIRLRPTVAQFHNTLGNALTELKRFEEARFAFEWALRLDPGFGEARANLANALQELDRPEEAVAEYRRALAARPMVAEIHNNLGNALRRAGKPEDAIASFRQALRLNPHYPEAYVNLGGALLEAGARDEALACCEEAIRLNPLLPAAHSNRAAVLVAQGRFEKAEAAGREALRLAPGHAAAHHNLGDVLRAQGRHEEAIEHYREALRIRPRSPDTAWNLAGVLEETGRFEDAASCVREHLRTHPDFEAAHKTLGRLLVRAGRLEEAADVCSGAFERWPDRDSLRMLAVVLSRLGRHLEAESAGRRLLSIDPGDPESHRILGNILFRQRRLDDAASCYDTALRLSPGDAGAHYNRALLLLLRGEFEEGWREYEWRWRRPDVRVAAAPAPRWQGEPLEGRRILISAEQGLGDSIQFLRYLPLVREAGGQVVFQCPAALLPWLEKQPALGEVVDAAAAAPQADFYAPLLSLPHIFRTTLGAIPCRMPYLSVDQRSIEAWGAKLSDPSGLRVGLVWAGSRHNPEDRSRSIPPGRFQPLWDIPGVSFVCLQERAPDGELPIRYPGPWGDIENFAAILMNLDLIISADTMPAHLAGALGRPVWTLLRFATDYRWMLDREDSPWYPTMRLFRQPRAGDWDAVVREIAAALRNYAGRQ